MDANLQRFGRPGPLDAAPAPLPSRRRRPPTRPPLASARDLAERPASVQTGPAMTASAIDPKGLTESPGARDVRRGIDLSAATGDVVSRIALSGLGNSTLGRGVTGLDDSQQGDPMGRTGTGPARCRTPATDTATDTAGRLRRALSPSDME